jgi:hypothetical protein
LRQAFDQLFCGPPLEGVGQQAVILRLVFRVIIMLTLLYIISDMTQSGYLNIPAYVIDFD